MEWSQNPLLFGYDFLFFLESIRNPLLDFIFQTASFLGNKEFYIVFFPILFWVFSKRYGLRLLTIFLISGYVNGLLKLLFSHPRPDPEKINVLFASSKGFADYGIPSGHSQNAIALWGLVFLYTDKKWIKIVSGIFMVLIPFSRLYNANHFVADVLAGLAIGALLLAVFYKKIFSPKKLSEKEDKSLEGKFYKFIFRFQPQKGAQRVEIKIPALLWINLILFLMLHYLYPDQNLARILGTMMGALLGYAVLTLRGGFSLIGTIWHKIARILIGFSGVVTLQVGIKWGFIQLLGQEALQQNPDFALLRYMLIALWAIWLAPETFIALRLASRCSYENLLNIYHERIGR